MRTLNLLVLLALGCAPMEGEINLDTASVDTAEDADTDTDTDTDTDDTDTGDTGDTDTGDTDDTGWVDDPDVDDDNDGFTENQGDCNDALPAFNPAATDVVGDSLDQNCDGIDGTDMDGDGHASTASGGDDCDDTADTTYPGAPEIWYDGVDQQCDGTVEDGDQDGDGYDSTLVGGIDCDDTDSSMTPENVEDNTNGTDDNCNGVVDGLSLTLWASLDVDASTEAVFTATLSDGDIGTWTLEFHRPSYDDTIYYDFVGSGGLVLYLEGYYAGSNPTVETMWVSKYQSGQIAFVLHSPDDRCWKWGGDAAYTYPDLPANCVEDDPTAW